MTVDNNLLKIYTISGGKFMEVKKLENRDEYLWMIKEKHYAQRVPSISYAYGLYIDEKLVAVCTYGKPASHSLCIGLLGKEYAKKVYELNRLIAICKLPKNALSWFVSQTLKLLKPLDLAIVSYADEGAGHFGYIYQATNFIYTGKTQERTDKYVPNGGHSRHYTDEFNHLRKFRTSKHRYVYFTGKSRKKFIKLLKYPVMPYPKGDNTRYVLGDKIKAKVLNKNTGEIFYE